MSLALATARKDWRRFWRDPAAMLLWLGIPFAIGTILTLMSGGRDGPTIRADVLVADQDDSFLSNALVMAMNQDAAGGVMAAERVEEADGRARLDAGEATALLIIPEGFGQALADDTDLTLTLVKNPAQRILPEIVEQSLEILADGTFYVQRILGDEMRDQFTGESSENDGPSDALVTQIGLLVNGAIRDLRDDVFPPALRLEIGKPPEVARADSIAAAQEAALEGEEEEPRPQNMALLFAPSLLFMSLLFIAQGIAGDIWKEREMGTLRRAVTAPAPVHAFLLGKLLAGVALVALLASAVLVAGYSFFELEWVTLPLALFWCALSGGMLLMLLMLIKLHATTARSADILSMVVIFPLMMLGGSFFPFEAMGEPLRTWGQFTPNGWALMRLKEILLGDWTPASLAMSTAALAGVTLLLFLWAAARLGGRFSRS